MIRSLLKKLLFLVITVTIVYGIYWMIDKDGAIEIKNKATGLFQNNKNIESAINNDGEIIVDSGIVFSDTGTNSSGTNNIEEINNIEILDDTENLEIISGSISQTGIIAIPTNTGSTTPKTSINIQSTTKTTVKKTTTSNKTSSQESILNTLFK